MTGRLEVARATPADREPADAYARAHSEGRLFHLSAWSRIAEEAYGYRNETLVARRGEAIVGLLPLIDVRAPLTGRALVSTAFSTGGGPLADDEAATRALCDAAIARGRALNVRYVELRASVDGDARWRLRDGVYANFEIDLASDEEAMLKQIPRRRRAVIRKAMKSERDGELSVSVEQNIDDFYRLYSLALRNHGTPVFPKRFLLSAQRHFGRAMEVSLARYHGRPLAALVSFYFRDRVMPYYNGAIGAARDVYASDLLYWHQMRRAIASGRSVYDFGRSKYGTGPFDYKVFWGAEPQPLAYAYALVEASEPPDLRPNNAKFAAAVAAWKRLPAPIANAAGPILARNFP